MLNISKLDAVRWANIRWSKQLSIVSRITAVKLAIDESIDSGSGAFSFGDRCSRRRGGKYSDFEGGIRGAAFISGDTCQPPYVVLFTNHRCT